MKLYLFFIKDEIKFVLYIEIGKYFCFVICCPLLNLDQCVLVSLSQLVVGLEMSRVESNLSELDSTR